MSTKTINRTVILGRIGKAPEVRFMPNTDNQIVANFSVATTDYWKDKQTGEQKEHTEWHRLVAYGRNAEIVRDYAGSGQLHHFTGKLKTRKWTDNNQIDRYTTEIEVNDIILLPQGSGKPNQADGDSQQQSSHNHNEPVNQ